MNIKIPAGGMYQEWMSLIDLLEREKVLELEALASSNGWRTIQPREASDMGFNELADWSVAESDVLVLIDNTFLVCIPKKDFHVTEN